MSRLSTIWRTGRVQRCHVTPHIGDSSNAAHEWGVARCVLEMFPDASRDLIIYCLAHDDPEVSTGDIPRPAKWASPVLDRESKDLEAAFYETYRIHLPELGERDTLRFMAADIVELWLFSQHQLNFGNLYFTEIKLVCEEYALRLATKLESVAADDARAVRLALDTRLSTQANYEIVRKA